MPTALPLVTLTVPVIVVVAADAIGASPITTPPTMRTPSIAAAIRRDRRPHTSNPRQKRFIFTLVPSRRWLVGAKRRREESSESYSVVGRQPSTANDTL